MLRCLLDVIRRLFDKDLAVLYTSVPVWKPWRDF